MGMLADVERLEEEDNRKAFDALATAMQVDVPLALVGAGVSMRHGYPSWERLVTQLYEQAKKADSRAPFAWTPDDLEVLTRKEKDLLWPAQAFRDLIGEDAYYELVQKWFGPNQVAADELVQIIRTLPFSHFLTTNYDDVLEREPDPQQFHIVNWNDSSKLTAFINCLGSRKADVRHLVYLHGRFDSPKETILTQHDYDQRYFENDRARRKLFAIFATKSVVFLGFSLRDPDLMLMFREVTASLAGGQPRHYALMPQQESDNALLIRLWFRDKFGVEPIFYPATKNHRGLLEILRRLKEGGGESAAGAMPSSIMPGAGGPRSFAPSLENAPDDHAVARPTGKPSTRALVREVENAMRAIPRKFDPDDPQKGRWGGQSQTSERELTARVSEDGDGWFLVRLTLRKTANGPDLQGPVEFHLHDTFSPDTVQADEVTADSATLQLHAYGAFTVGVEEGPKKSRRTLELDLATLEDAPMEFRNA